MEELDFREIYKNETIYWLFDYLMIKDRENGNSQNRSFLAGVGVALLFTVYLIAVTELSFPMDFPEWVRYTISAKIQEKPEILNNRLKMDYRYGIPDHY